MIQNKDVAILNLTNQDIKIYPQESVDIPFPVRKIDEAAFLKKCIVIKSEGHARCEIFRDSETIKVSVRSINKNIPLSYTNIGITSGLPHETDGTIILVSQLVYNAVHHVRKDVYMVDKPIRNEAGAVIACRSFSRCVYDDHIKPIQSTIKYLNKRLVNINPDNTLEYREIMACLVELNSYIRK